MRTAQPPVPPLQGADEAPGQRLVGEREHQAACLYEVGRLDHSTSEQTPRQQVGLLRRAAERSLRRQQQVVSFVVAERAAPPMFSLKLILSD
mmetsp:Transcript_41346/g.103898  ORF Transcript_41346/g.103898 Transcript_41346/m.103898 type:complete len:92 (+) Transcript_41346:1051-1326(+)